MPVANNIVMCHLKRIQSSDYAVQFTPEELVRLRNIFQEGVCDYTKPGVEQRRLKDTWLSLGQRGYAKTTK